MDAEAEVSGAGGRRDQREGQGTSEVEANRKRAFRRRASPSILMVPSRFALSVLIGFAM